MGEKGSVVTSMKVPAVPPVRKPEVFVGPLKLCRVSVTAGQGAGMQSLREGGLPGTWDCSYWKKSLFYLKCKPSCWVWKADVRKQGSNVSYEPPVFGLTPQACQIQDPRLWAGCARCWSWEHWCASTSLPGLRMANTCGTSATCRSDNPID